MSKDIKELLKKFNITPHGSLDNYELAFTHSSYNNDANTTHHDYERLEFLGDSIIGFVVADLAFRVHKDMKQGELSKLRASIVQGPSLAHMARDFSLGDYIKIGKSINYDITSSKKILEDVFEAFIGAIYLDQGINFTYEFVENIFREPVLSFDINDLTDYKTKLQETIASRQQKGDMKGLKYILVEERGPSHNPYFTIEVTFDGISFGIGSGKTKKEAEQNAAKMALEKMVK